jgi:hypothetical protein
MMFSDICKLRNYKFLMDVLQYFINGKYDSDAKIFIGHARQIQRSQTLCHMASCT